MSNTSLIARHAQQVMTGPFLMEDFRIAHGMDHVQRARSLTAEMQTFIQTLVAEIP